jgi:hypothetical protein
MIALVLRPFNRDSYVLGQRMDLIFGVVLVAVLLLAGIGWILHRWRTRHERGKHAALHRVRNRAREKAGQ